MTIYDVVIRCKNEGKLVGKTLASLFAQTKLPSKVVFVDSGSTDESLKVASAYNCQIVHYPRNIAFNYSISLNIGILECESPVVLLLSAHCVLATAVAVERLLESMNSFDAAGVFGRQLPTTNSNAFDTRDLLTIFGRERIIYWRYPFFHNAFAVIRRRVWEKTPFDTSVNGIEDRLWAEIACRQGFKIVYEPSASVFHEHGLNQGTDAIRAERVCKALYELHKNDEFQFPPHLTPP